MLKQQALLALTPYPTLQTVPYVSDHCKLSFVGSVFAFPVVGVNSTAFLAGATPASRAASRSLNRRSESKLDSRASRQAMGSEAQGSRGDRGSGEKQATVSVVMSAESAQRLKAQAAESGLHQSDSGLASESYLLSEPSLVCLCFLKTMISVFALTACRDI